MENKCKVPISTIQQRMDSSGIEPAASEFSIAYSTLYQLLIVCYNQLQTQRQNGGRCGVCEDSYTASHKDHEAGGKYALGIITRWSWRNLWFCNYF